MNDLVLPLGDLGITNIKYAQMMNTTELLLIGDHKQVSETQ